MFSEDSRVMQTQVAVASTTARASRKLTQSEFDKVYKVQEAVAFIKKGDYQRIGLQFPDSQLHDTVRLIHRVTDLLVEANPESKARLFILADNTFGACCPDEITAQHYAADAIVHFGTTCMSKSIRLPVMYVHDHTNAASEDTIAENFARRFTKTVLDRLLCAIGGNERANDEVVEVVVFMPVNVWSNVGTKIVDAVKANVAASAELKDEVMFAEGNKKKLLVAFANPRDDGCCDTEDISSPEAAKFWEVNGMRFPRVCDEEKTTKKQVLVFGGSADSDHTLVQLAMIGEFNSNQWARAFNDDEEGGIEETEWAEAVKYEATLHVIHPDTTPASDIDETAEEKYQNEANDAINKAMKLSQARLRQRMFNVETLKCVQSVGILVASLSIHLYREVAEAVRSALIRHGKRAYLIYVGHPNEFKIANFADSMDAFCVIACPNSRLAHFPNKSDNLLKPMVSPFEVMLSLGIADFNCPEAFTTMFAPVLRLANVAAAKKKVDNSGDAEADAAESGVLVKGRAMNVAIQGGGGALQRLHEREYIGLDPKIGQTAVQTELVEGRSGIARGYETERESQNAPVDLPEVK